LTIETSTTSCHARQLPKILPRGFGAVLRKGCHFYPALR
jgi:hypothetical protein